MSLNVPTSRQWVQFPMSPTQAVMIAWKEGRQARTAKYYVCKCYWGSLKKTEMLSTVEPESKEGDVPRFHSDSPTANKPVVAKRDQELDILGETRIFIAAEYVEQQYRGGPLKEFHIRDIAGFNADDKNLCNWITMQLNRTFCYGQNGSITNRWIVYHPAISATISEPKIYQHRFTGLASAELVQAAAGDLPIMAPKTFKAAAKAGAMISSIGTDIIKSSVGQFLHHFLDSQGVTVAQEFLFLLYVKEGPARSNRERIEKHDTTTSEATKNRTRLNQLDHIPLEGPEERQLVALQFIEIQKAKMDNQKSNVSAFERVRKELAMQEMEKASLATQHKWYGLWNKMSQINIRGSAKIHPMPNEPEAFTALRNAIEEEAAITGDVEQAILGLEPILLKVLEGKEKNVMLDIKDVIIPTDAMAFDERFGSNPGVPPKSTKDSKNSFYDRNAVVTGR